MKKMNLTVQIPVTYTFSGNNRDASASVASDTPVTPKVINTWQGGSNLEPVKIPIGSPVRIAKARLLSTGAQNLQAAPGKNAGEIKISFTGDFVAEPSNFTLAFVRWNEWEEKNIVVNLKNKASFGISILAGSTIRMDDYNIQDVYIGQTFTAVLELELQVNNNW